MVDLRPRVAEEATAARPRVRRRPLARGERGCGAAESGPFDREHPGDLERRRDDLEDRRPDRRAARRARLRERRLRIGRPVHRLAWPDTAIVADSGSDRNGAGDHSRRRRAGLQLGGNKSGDPNCDRTADVDHSALHLLVGNGQPGNRTVVPGISWTTRPWHSTSTPPASRGSTLIITPFPLTRRCRCNPR